MLARNHPVLSDRQLVRLLIAVAASLLLHVVAVHALRSFAERSSIGTAASPDTPGAALSVRLSNMPKQALNDAVPTRLPPPQAEVPTRVAASPQTAAVEKTPASHGSEALDHRIDVKSLAPSVEHFFDPRQTDLRARLLAPPDLSALDAPGMAYQGQTVRLRIFVDQSGHAVKVESLGPGDASEAMIAILEKAIKDAPFAPGIKDGKNVASFFLVDLSVKPEEALPPLIEKFSEPSK